MRLEGKVAIIIGAGQSPGEGIGNGRATAIRFAQEGAKILAVDRDIASAKDTAALVTKEGAECVAFEADVTDEATLAEAVDFARRRWGRIDILHNNVGVSISGGDAPLLDLTEEIFDLPAMAQLSVGPSWSALAESERQAIIEAFKRMTIASYAKNFAKFAGEQFQGDVAERVKVRRGTELAERTVDQFRGQVLQTRVGQIRYDSTGPGQNAGEASLPNRWCHRDQGGLGKSGGHVRATRFF